MTILGIDGATDRASVTLYESGAGVISTVSGLTGATSETLMTAVDKVLRDGGVSVRDVDFGAVTSGPGSFTGIRVAMSLMKGLFFGRKIVTVSTLYAIAAAVACNYHEEEQFAVNLDARAHKYYAAKFYVEKGQILQRVSDDEVFDVKEKTVFTDLTDLPPLSETVCRYAETVAKLSKAEPADTAMPTFILQSQAERLRKDNNNGRQ